MEWIDISTAWGLLAAAATGVAVLPWSDGELRESHEAFQAVPMVALGAAGWAWRSARELNALGHVARRALSYPRLRLGLLMGG